MIGFVHVPRPTYFLEDKLIFRGFLLFRTLKLVYETDVVSCVCVFCRLLQTATARWDRWDAS